MIEFLSSTPVKVALAATGTAAVAVGSYLIGHNNGVQAGIQAVLEQIAAATLDKEEEADNQKN